MATSHPIAALALVLLLSPGCSEEAPAPPEPVRPVKLFTVSAGSGGTREYPGRIKAGQYSEMGFEVPGRVTEFVYKEGSPVEAGAVLARIDPRDYQARLDSAKARLNQTRTERERFRILYEKEVAPKSDFDVRDAAFKVAEAETREAQKALDDTTLRAPFKGVMARKLVEEFENVLAKQAVLVLQNDDLLELKVSVPERDLAGGRGRGATAEELTERLRPRVVLSALPGREFPAQLKELASVADPVTRTFEATFLFERPENANVLGGMTAKVVIDVPADSAPTGAMPVPVSAVADGAGPAPYVWVVDAETMVVSQRPVEVGEVTGSSILVMSGLESGETIAVSGVHHLRDGQTVRRYEP